MREELKNFYIFIVTNNTKENLDVSYNNYNTTRKKLDLHWTSLGQLED